MADYYSPTVIGEVIPSADMTKLERLLLSRIFDAEPDGEGLYFHSWQGPADMVSVPRAALVEAIAASRSQLSQVLAYVEDHLASANVDAKPNDNEVVALDLSGTSWEFILQDIVRRSATLRFITVMTAFTCSTMRRDGFGGQALFITDDAIKGCSTAEFLSDCLAEFASGPK